MNPTMNLPQRPQRKADGQFAPEELERFFDNILSLLSNKQLDDYSNLPATIKKNLNASGSAPIYACRAWVNFNGTDTITIRGSGNVASITDIGTGQYYVNFITAMPDGNIACVVSTRRMSTWADGGDNCIVRSSSRGYVQHVENSTEVDSSHVFMAVFR